LPIYSETISNENIIRTLGDKYHDVLIIGCGACMNEGLSYRYDVPIYNGSPSVPSATVAELGRIAEMLIANGYQVETKYYEDINGFYCMTDVSSDAYPLDWTGTPDIILMLSCASGCEGLRSRLPKARIVKITELIGGVSYGYIDKDDQRVICKEFALYLTCLYSCLCG
jgi:hypothetical protein